MRRTLMQMGNCDADPDVRRDSDEDSKVKDVKGDSVMGILL